jgi:NAD(P)-dependent dehydrogenase (short-subunit alcohol dehydrogenase family)
MPSQPVILILGAGPNIGQHVSLAFAATGYAVALASRRSKAHDADDAATHAQYEFDLSNPSAMSDLFAKVTHELGVPSVVVYNGASALKFLHHTTSHPVF